MKTAYINWIWLFQKKNSLYADYVTFLQFNGLPMYVFTGQNTTTLEMLFFGDASFLAEPALDKSPPKNGSTDSPQIEKDL